MTGVTTAVVTFVAAAGTADARRNTMPETVTVERSDITLTEQVESVSILTHETVWYAKFEGALSTGERARLTRYSSTPAAALASLEQAIRDQGWEIV